MVGNNTMTVFASFPLAPGVAFWETFTILLSLTVTTIFDDKSRSGPSAGPERQSLQTSDGILESVLGFILGNQHLFRIRRVACNGETSAIIIGKNKFTNVLCGVKISTYFWKPRDFRSWESVKRYPSQFYNFHSIFQGSFSILGDRINPTATECC